jgi:hypothetical protein
MPPDRIGPTGREAVQAFFQYRLEDDDLLPRAVSYRLPLSLFGAGFLIGYGSLVGLIGLGGAALVGGVILMLAGLGLGFFIEGRRIERELAQRCAAKVANHAEFHRLVRVTRAVQADHLARALCRVVSRTHIDRTRLRKFDQRSLFEQERSLFDEAKLERKIGDLIDKSMRTISMGDAFSSEVTPVSRRVRGPGGKPGRLYFNPIRLVALLVTESELVSCIVQLDLVGKNRHEEVRRIEHAKIVDVRFEDTHERVPASAESIAQLAEQLGYCANERDEHFGKPDQRGDLREARVTTRLLLTSSDGGTLTVPVRADIQLVAQSSGLDRDETLSVDELEIDCVVHTLNRLLRGQESSATPRVRTVSAAGKKAHLRSAP